MLPNYFSHLHPVYEAGNKISQECLSQGNKISPLISGDEAFPAMLSAINRAEKFIFFTTYQFDKDGIGRKFVAVLAQAVSKGVDVRVIVDAVGAALRWPTIKGDLIRAGIKVKMFSLASGSRGSEKFL